MVLPRNYSIVEKLKTKYPNINISTETTDAECLKKINLGKYDAFVGPAAVVNYFIKKEKLQNIIITAKTTETYMPSFAVAKKETQLNSILYKSLDNISTSEKKKIIDNWLFNLVVPFYEQSIFWEYFSIGMFAILLFFTVVNLFLKSKVKKRTLELNTAKIAAEDANKFKTNLIQNISHEIRTPMNGILGFSELLKNDNLKSNEKENYLNIIIQSVTDLKTSVNNLLDLSAIETKQVQLFEEFVDIDDLFKGLQIRFKQIALNKNIDFNVITNSDNTDIIFKTDKEKLKKALSFIIDNAVKFTSSGFVEVSYKFNPNELTVTVKDSGIGIEEDQKEFLFESFSQLNTIKTKHYGGLGLGLYFAEKYISLLKGNIQFTSTKNVGSEFNIKFSNIVTSTKTEETAKKTKYLKKQNETIKILVAEDVTTNYILLEKILKKNSEYNFIIERAENGQEAIDLHSKNKYDLLFMDIKMPNLDGFEATKAIREFDTEVIIIAQTAFSRDEDLYNGFKNGFDEYLSKPIDYDKLRAVLQKYIQN